MLRHKLKYEEKLIQKDLSDASAALLSDLNWKARDYVFDLGAKVVMGIIRGVKNKKSKKTGE